jgi:DNA-directed RNA polymerase subunit RPC12/RpoP
VEQFQNLEAVSLYCPRCKAAMPVRKRLLLVLPESEMYEYLCTRCGASVGKKNEPVSRRPALTDPPRL